MTMEFTDKPLEPFGDVLLDMPLPSDLRFKTPMVFRLLKALQQHKYLPPVGAHMAELCFEEALINAMQHGNNEDPSKKVRVVAFGDDDRWGLIIEDEGKGFGPEDLPDRDDPESIFHEAGRGILLMDHYLDELTYNRRGNKLRMIRHRQSEPEPSYREQAERASALRTAVAAQGTAASMPTALVDLPDDIDLDLDLEPQEMAEIGEPTAAAQAADDLEKVVVVTIPDARVTEANAEKVAQRLTEAIQDAPSVVIDMSSVQFISSVGLSIVMAAYKEVTNRNGNIILASMQPSVREIFDVTGLLRVLKTAPDTQTAIQSVQSKQ